MKKLICILILLLIWRICDAQNLVPNPGFEDTLYCPPSVSHLGACTNWNSYKETPDYFNSCSGVSSVGVPYNMTGFQNAHNGNAYCGFFVLFQQVTNEILGAQLMSPLVIGQKYFVSFYLNRAMGSTAFNNLGVLFSTSPSYYSSYPIQNFAHVKADSIITDTLNWTRVSGSFIADSVYTYIGIGCFFDINHIDTINFGSSLSFAYYFVDDICVSTDSLTCNSTVGINEIKSEEEFNLFPNPFTDRINITTKRNELMEVCMFDVTSRKILQSKFTNSVSLNTEQLPRGLYLYEIRSKNGLCKKGKVVKD